MKAYELAGQNFRVAESLLQLFEAFRDLHVTDAHEPLRLAVCTVLGVPENTAFQQVLNDRAVILSKATAPIPETLTAPGGPNFLLRQAIVVGCTALESFYWDALRENVLTIVRARKGGADISLRDIKLTLGDYLSIEAWEDPDVRLKQIILKNFERQTLYDVESIDRISKILTVPNLWDKVAERCGVPEKTLKMYVGELITRRNQIAHRADRPDDDSEEEPDEHGLRAISYAWANTRVQSAKNLVSASAEVFKAAIEKLEHQIAAAEEQQLARQTLKTASDE
jgi:hypothetical protein